jgi:hypothetical protein
MHASPQPRPVVGALGVALAVVLLAGCGSGGAPWEGDRVEDLVSRYTAEGLLREVTPTEDRIDRAARDIDVTCIPAGRPDYECIFHWGGELGPRRCTVRTDPAQTRVESMRCGGADEAPVTDDEFTDCSTIGPVVTATDPRHDLHENQRELAPAAARRAELRKTDLIAMRVAATEERLCVEWETVAPIEPKHSFNLWLWPSQAPPITLALSVTFEAGLAPDVRLSSRGSLSGRAGTSGRRTSVVIEADDIPPGDARDTLRDAFTFSAQSAWVAGRDHPDQAYGDSLPNATIRPTYP